MATPLGNLGDITLRGKGAWRAWPCIACEDTRMTRELLRLLDIAPPMLVSVRERNEREAASGVVSRIAAGDAVAYVSDAGTPAISDPGRDWLPPSARRVSDNSDSGVSAVTAALSVAGSNRRRSAFLWFCADVERRACQLRRSHRHANGETSVFFESPHRIDKTLLALAVCRLSAGSSLPGNSPRSSRPVSALTPGAIGEWLVSNAERLRGIVVVAGADQAARASAIDGRTLLKALLPELPRPRSQAGSKAQRRGSRIPVRAGRNHEIWLAAFQ